MPGFGALAELQEITQLSPKKADETPSGLWFDAPDGVERILQLAEYSAGAEERDGDTDHGSDGTARGLAGTLSDVLHRLGAAAICSQGSEGKGWENR
jgi:hypothetical protein